MAAELDDLFSSGSSDAAYEARLAEQERVYEEGRQINRARVRRDLRHYMLFLKYHYRQEDPENCFSAAVAVRILRFLGRDWYSNLEVPPRRSITILDLGEVFNLDEPRERTLGGLYSESSSPCESSAESVTGEWRNVANFIRSQFEGRPAGG
eukprot:TRINITY_DN73963_c0_g1_i1.p1 TRINITY_DN73963_c0_g1~~TRINITY_DN73963_c0_g1_i1.p1  ORF type:complete len:152 (+),score=26.18 TRINITY_DN73963_c0_g1_i1:114-569(+)